MTTKHTPEPWAEQHRTVYHVETGLTIAVCSPVRGGKGTYTNQINHRDITENECLENVRRVASCVNACAGIPTEALKNGVIKELLDSCKTFIIPF